MRKNKWFGLAAVVLASGLAGCEDDGVLALATEEKECEGLGCDEASIIKDDCDHKCDAEAKKCENGQLVTCENDSNGCRVWSIARDCGDGMYCDSAQNACVEGCQNACELGAKKCDGAQIQTCVKDEAENACTRWDVAVGCGENMHCDAATNECVAGCEDECVEGQNECYGEAFRTCGQFDEDSCLEFSEFQECGTDELCDPIAQKCVTTVCETECVDGETVCGDDQHSVLACHAVAGTRCNALSIIQNCVDGESCKDTADGVACVKDSTDVGPGTGEDPVVKICDVGAKKCSDDSKSLMTCVANSTGNEWKSESCGAMTCNAAKLTCEATCTDACTENATQCASGNKATQVCKRGANGCTAWTNGDSCAQTCSAGKCADYCGDDCEPFSIVILPDTQNYVRYDSVKTDTTYHKQMNWIVKNMNTSKLPNLKHVVHMGDITNDNTDVQWKIAKDAQQILKDNGVSFSVVNGNHDYRISGKVGGRSKTKFTTYFPESWLKGIKGYGGIYDGANTYMNFRAGNQDYLVLNLEFAPRQQTICWANDLLQKAENKNKKVIIATHANLSHDAKYSGKPKNQFVANGASGSELWNELTSRHSNIMMILNGHVGDSEHRTDNGLNGNPVQQILTDYQFERNCSESKLSSCTNHCRHAVNAGNGWLRVLTFYPKTNKVEARTVSVLSGNKSLFSSQGTDQFFCSPMFDMANKGKSCTDCGQWYPKAPSDAAHQFDLTFDFTTPSTNVYKTNGYLGFVHRNINATSTGDQINPVIATNNTGRSVFVWQDNSSSADGKRSDGTNDAHDIYARIMLPEACNYSGHSELVINEKTAGHQEEPDVAMDQNGNFVVVWTDDNDNNGSTQIYMRGFNADGTQRFATKTVNTVDTRNQYQPHIAMAPDGQFAVSWTDTASSKDTPQINVRGFNADGSQAFAQRAVTDAVAGTQVHSDIFMDKNHNIVVVWEDDGDANGSTQIKMRLINANGTSKTDAKTVNSVASGNQNSPSVSGRSDGAEFMVVWQNVASSQYSIMGRTFNADGKQIDADFTLSTSDTAQKVTDPQVCMNDSANAVAVWYNPTTKNVVRRHFSGGKPTGSAETITNSPSNASTDTNAYGAPTAKAYQPAIACVPGGNISMVTFADDNDGNATFEIFGVGFKVK